MKDHKPDMAACDGFGPPALTPEQERQALAVTAVDDETHLEVAKAIDGSPFMVYATAHKASERITALVALLAHHYGPLVERVRIAEHALSEFKKDRERTERAFYESAKSERDALKAENERLRRSPFELDCMAGKLTTFDAICGYVSKLESDLADAKAEEAGE